MAINYKNGDATRPDGPAAEQKVIMHICNDVGAWGAGFVVALSKAFGGKNDPDSPEAQYRSWFAGDSRYPKFELGKTCLVMVGDNNTYVANMIAQDGIRSKGDKKDTVYVSYEALRKCLAQVRHFCVDEGATVHCPRIGAGLGGGDWNTIAAIITEELCNYGIAVTVYDFVS